MFVLVSLISERDFLPLHKTNATIKTNKAATTGEIDPTSEVIEPPAVVGVELISPAQRVPKVAHEFGVTGTGVVAVFQNWWCAGKKLFFGLRCAFIYLQFYLLYLEFCVYF
jgi:hypothetical protein